jgi:hypothetical protein
MFKRFKEWLQARKERKIQRGIDNYAHQYVLKNGYNQDRDLTLLVDITARVSDKYVKEVKAVYEELHKGAIVRGESDFQEDMVTLVTNILGMVSREYMALLMIYFGNIENLTSYVHLLLFAVEESVIKLNKQKIREIRGKIEV